MKKVIDPVAKECLDLYGQGGNNWLDFVDIAIRKKEVVIRMT